MNDPTKLNEDQIKHAITSLQQYGTGFQHHLAMAISFAEPSEKEILLKAFGPLIDRFKDFTPKVQDL